MSNTGTIKDYLHAPIMGEEGPRRAEENWSEAEHETGIAYIAPWEDPYAGFPEHARRCARALNDAMGEGGWPVHLRSYDPSIQWHMHFEVGGRDKVLLREKYDDLLTQSVKNYAVEIYQVVPSDNILQQITTHRWVDPFQLSIINRFRIISTVFERDRISDHAVTCLNRVGMVWVANEKDAKMLLSCGVKRVAVVPIPYSKDDPLLSFQGQPRRPGSTRFYHIGKWEPRKAHHELLGAFMLAFKPGEAKLYFKTSTTAPDYAKYEKTSDYLNQKHRPPFESGPQPKWRAEKGIPYPSPERSVHLWVEHPGVKANGWTVEDVNANIFFIRRRLSDAQIKQLHSMGDVYLSLSRGEGFDMPAYDAKIAGNRMVYTPSGGPQDFATESDFQVPSNGLVPCHPFYRWDDAKYLDWDYTEAVYQLRQADAAVQRKSDADVKGASGAFRSDKVGTHMVDLVRQVARDGAAYAAEQNRRAREEAEGGESDGP